MPNEDTMPQYDEMLEELLAEYPAAKEEVSALQDKLAEEMPEEDDMEMDEDMDMEEEAPDFEADEELDMEGDEEMDFEDEDEEEEF